MSNLYSFNSSSSSSNKSLTSFGSISTSSIAKPPNAFTAATGSNVKSFAQAAAQQQQRKSTGFGFGSTQPFDTKNSFSSTPNQNNKKRPFSSFPTQNVSQYGFGAFTNNASNACAGSGNPFNKKKKNKTSVAQTAEEEGYISVNNLNNSGSNSKPEQSKKSIFKLPQGFKGCLPANSNNVSNADGNKLGSENKHQTESQPSLKTELTIDNKAKNSRQRETKEEKETSCFGLDGSIINNDSNSLKKNNPNNPTSHEKPAFPTGLKSFGGKIHKKTTDFHQNSNSMPSTFGGTFGARAAFNETKNSFNLKNVGPVSTDLNKIPFKFGQNANLALKPTSVSLFSSSSSFTTLRSHTADQQKSNKSLNKAIDKPSAKTLNNPNNHNSLKNISGVIQTKKLSLSSSSFTNLQSRADSPSSLSSPDKPRQPHNPSAKSFTSSASIPLATQFQVPTFDSPNGPDHPAIPVVNSFAKAAQATGHI